MSFRASLRFLPQILQVPFQERFSASWLPGVSTEQTEATGYFEHYVILPGPLSLPTKDPGKLDYIWNILGKDGEVRDNNK